MNEREGYKTLPQPPPTKNDDECGKAIAEQPLNVKKMVRIDKRGMMFYVIRRE